MTAGADVVYFCLNAVNYARWADEFPPLQQAVLTGAAAAGARLVVLDNLYAYGPTHGHPLVETLQARPSSAKAATRAAMTDRAPLTPTPPGRSRSPLAEPPTTSVPAPPAPPSARPCSARH